MRIPSIKKNEKKAKKRLEKWRDKIVFVRKRSSDATKDIPDGLDFVYIDGDHSYKVVKEDLENYYKKVIIGGVFCGHDINISDVNKAFSEFIVKKKLTPIIDFQDWCVIKK